jgi:hypothetical protein
VLGTRGERQHVSACEAQAVTETFREKDVCQLPSDWSIEAEQMISNTEHVVFLDKAGGLGKGENKQGVHNKRLALLVVVRERCWCKKIDLRVGVVLENEHGRE